MNLNTSQKIHIFKPLYKPNQLVLGQGCIAVVTGWTVREFVAKKLDRSQYAAIGQLYSATRGIDFLVRNLLLNPHVRSLVIINATKEDRNAGSCQCLLDFFQNGFTQGKSDTGRDCWVVNSEITGYIDIEVSENALNRLRQVLKVEMVSSISEGIEKVHSLAKLSYSSWGEPLEFPKAEQESAILPGTLYGHRIEGKTIAETWIRILHRIRTTGTIRPTGYDGKWQELIDLMAVVTDEPSSFYFPEPNYLPVDPEFISNYLPQVLHDAPYQEGVKYTYGQRLRSWFGRDQIEQCITKLIGEIDAASAVMSLWDVKDHEKGGSPCLNHIWVRVVENEISLTAVLRSNDMFAAWVANAMGLRALQRYIRDEIANRSSYDLKMGALITLSQSAHIYDDTWGSVDRMIANQYTNICSRQTYDDACGNFLIEVCNHQILVTQTTSGSGAVVKQYSGKDSLRLIRDICTSSPAIRPDHIGYLGIELQKAYECMKSGKSYNQDE